MTDWNMLAEAVYAGIDMTGTGPVEVDDLTEARCVLCGRPDEQTRLLDGRVVCTPCAAVGNLR